MLAVYLVNLWSRVSAFWGGLWSRTPRISQEAPQSEKSPAVSAAASPYRIVVETVPNQDCRHYHLNIEISRSHIEHFLFPLFEEYAEALKKCGPLGGRLVQSLSLGIDGITEVMLQQYSLSVIVATAFTWDEIEPKILALLKDCFGEVRDQVTVEHRRMFGGPIVKEELEESCLDLVGWD